MSRASQLEAAYKAVVEEIASFCKTHQLNTPNLVAVSKYKPKEDILTLYNLGHRHFGENYVQELTEKAKELPDDIQWHFIGNLQSNKAKIAGQIPNLAYVETLDSESKATKLNNQRGTLPPLKVYIQVNTSDEEQKSGLFDFASIESLAKHVVSNCPSLTLVGLMTIGSLSQSKSESENQDFKKLLAIREKLADSLKVSAGSLGLSMGMSSDYLEAIRQGSTNVRVGSQIFGGRQTKEEIQANSSS
ncbi:hypothetical protein B9G98_04514 [Wickerhamiella sorbophila]|uniref:Pyridoxal phosphate homeostasis protein n=1 Tax=Wickerhamiella sorbophila TaxID=45607 RepID=A0A2T0FPH9_9ASCO|nr:hypothetical protein B9G98_04514 [Wickerhamiella sorbophila]PRT56894.1 hypothetical protein B9G98_04514 [Wickerhamiella sorbophila]